MATVRRLNQSDCLMVNPYEPPNMEAETPRTRDWDRDQCPACLQRQSVWAAMKTIRSYRCKHCSEPLVVTLQGFWSQAFFTALVVALAAHVILRYAYDLNPSLRLHGINLALIVAMFVLRYQFGHFHPADPRWTHPRPGIP